MKREKDKRESNSGSLFTKETFGMALVLFSAVSLILMLLSDVLFGGQWIYTQFFYGALGYFSFAVFIVLGYLGVVTVLDKKGSGEKWKVVLLASLLLVFLVCLVHTITASDPMGGFSEYIRSCYARGEDGLSTATVGGAVFGVLVYLPLKYLSPIGCYILFPLLICADLLLLFRAAIADAVKKTTRKRAAFSEDKISGVMAYPDEDMDFTSPPRATESRLYFGSGPSEFSQPTKKESRTDKEKAYDLLYPDSRRTAKTTTGFGTKDSFGVPGFVNRQSSAERSGRWESAEPIGRSQRERSDPAPFDRQATVSRIRGNDERMYDDRDSSLRRERDLGRNDRDSSLRRERDLGRDDRDSSLRGERDLGRNDRNREYNSSESRGRFTPIDSDRISDNQRYTERGREDEPQNRADLGSRDIFAERTREPSADDARRSRTTRTEDRGMSEIRDDSEVILDGSPFADKWDTLPQRARERMREEKLRDKPELDEKEEIKPTNVRRFDIGDEKKAVVIENDIGDAVMPDDEVAAKKPSTVTAPDKAEEEKPAEREVLEYIGIPDMPLRYKYKRPPLDLYNDNPKDISANDDNIEERIRIIENTLDSFGIHSEVKNVVKGPTITRYELAIPDGIAVSRIPPKANDLKMRLEVEAVRIEAPIPGKNLIGVEVPNLKKEVVGMKELLMEKDYQRSSPDALSIVLGQDVVGNPVITDLAKTPHLLVAGATGMGKSVFLNALIMSLVTKYGPEDLRIVLVDPKQVEFSDYEGLPHLLVNSIITEAPLCVAILDWAISEMESRYKIFSSRRGVNIVRNIDEYNNSINPRSQRKMPKIVIIIDELGDLFSISQQMKRDIEDRIKRLTQKARAAGIHVVVATQRPDVTVITGVIKTNLPTRIAFKVLNYADSKTILNDQGAENLLGKGDMLFKAANSSMLKRVQGAFVTNKEMSAVLQYIKENNACYYDENAQKFLDNKKASTATGGTGASVSFGGGDEGESSEGTFNNVRLDYIRALKNCIIKKQASISLLQRCMSIGYSTAGRIIDWMESMNYIGPHLGSKPRDVLISMEEFEELYGGANID